jgi:hypothetical protein
MSAEINKLTLDYTEATSAALKVASELLASEQEKKAAADQRVEVVVALLKTAGLITAAQEKEAADQLSDHAGSLDLLHNVITHYGDQAQTTKKASADLGRGVDAPAKPSRNTNYVGERTSKQSAADDAFFNRIVHGQVS